MITGASSGLGLHCAEQLAHAGAVVFGISRSKPEQRVAIEGLSHLECDVTDTPAMEALLNKIEAGSGPITSFINNAGIALTQRPGVPDQEGFRSLLETNAIAPAVLTDIVASRMQRNKVAGSIVNVSSVLAQRGMPRLAAYGASKAALEAMTRQQAAQWARYGIRINAFAPGWFFSELTTNSLDQGLAPILRGMTPMRRIGTVEDMFGAVVFLISNASKFVTGSILTADGGYSI